MPGNLILSASALVRKVPWFSRGSRLLWDFFMPENLRRSVSFCSGLIRWKEHGEAEEMTSGQIDADPALRLS